MPPRYPMPDVLVVIPGILGSTLSRNGREVWGLSAAAGLHAVGSLGATLHGLLLENDCLDPALDDGVSADGLLPDVHAIPYVWKIDGYTKLTQTLTTAFDVQSGENYFELAYDWRRDNRVAACRLARDSHRWLRRWRKSSGNIHAKLILIAHSMGGLVARYFLEVLEGWRETKALVTFGTPYRGSVNALRTLVEGVRKGPFGILDLSALARSLTSLHQLLPTYPCLVLGDEQSVRLADAPPIPGTSADRIRAAATFHAEIASAVDDHLADEAYRLRRHRVVLVVGTEQPTLQSARLGGSGVEFLHYHARRDLRGDGTVPRMSATPVELSNLGLEMSVATCHASIQNADAALHHVRDTIAALDVDFGQPQYRIARALPSASVALDLEDAFWNDEPVALRIRVDPPPAPAMTVTIVDVADGQEAARAYVPGGHHEWVPIELPSLPPGMYRCTAAANYDPAVAASDVFSVFDVAHR